jgi:hypothetical protein
VNRPSTGARPVPRRLLALLLLFATPPLLADEPGVDADGFTPMFNGEDLAGWRHVNTAPSTWRFEEGLLVCSGKPIGELRTQRMYQNFVMELEWRHMVPKGNAGVFVWADDITARGVPFHRGIEVQVLENAYGNNDSHTTHGDIFPIHGATMTPVNGRGGSRAFPTENRSRPSPEWNHYRIEANDGEISLAVNGKVVTRGQDCNPRKGYICLESEGGIVHYRNVRIRELPETPIEPEQIAIAERGYRSLYNGVDLDDWRATGPWKVNDWVLNYDGQPETKDAALESKEQFGRVGFLFDVRRKENSGAPWIRVGPIGFALDPADGPLAEALRPGRWARVEGRIEGGELVIAVNGQDVMRDEFTTPAKPGPFSITPDGPVDLANVYVREVDEK